MQILHQMQLAVFYRWGQGEEAMCPKAEPPAEEAVYPEGEPRCLGVAGPVSDQAVAMLSLLGERTEGAHGQDTAGG